MPIYSDDKYYRHTLKICMEYVIILSADIYFDMSDADDNMLTRGNYWHSCVNISVEIGNNDGICYHFDALKKLPKISHFCLATRKRSILKARLSPANFDNNILRRSRWQYDTQLINIVIESINICVDISLAGGVVSPGERQSTSPSRQLPHRRLSVTRNY